MADDRSFLKIMQDATWEQFQKMPTSNPGDIALAIYRAVTIRLEAVELMLDDD